MYRRGISEETMKIYHKILTLTFNRILELNSTSMMYNVTKETRGAYTTRGKHCMQVMDIAMDLVDEFDGDLIATSIMAAAHDYGHTVLAHTGEIALARFLFSPKEFVEWEEMGEKGKKPREYFDHSKHSVVMLKNECKKMGIEIPEIIINGIEAHSTGSKGSSGMCRSFEAECVMRADKIASSISDMSDLMKSGAIDLNDEKKVRRDFYENEEVKETLSDRIFGGKKLENSDTSTCLKRVTFEILETSPEEKEKFMTKKEEWGGLSEEECIVRFGQENYDEIKKYYDDKINEHIERTIGFLRLPEDKQRSRMMEAIVGATREKEKNGEKIESGYKEEYAAQLTVPIDNDAMLAVCRGVMIGKEKARTLGKNGAELEGLIETVARFIYNNRAMFENEEPFCNWIVDENGEQYVWEKTVAYGIAEMDDLRFKEFVKELPDKGAKEELSKCKYRDPRDEKYLSGEGKGKKLKYSTIDFSNIEVLEGCLKIDVNKEYNKPQSSYMPGKNMKKYGVDR